MDSEELALESKCENLMNVVVESRKRFGKSCIDYEKKASIMENKLLNLQIETMSKCRPKPKNTIPNTTEEASEDLDDLIVVITEKHKRVQDMIQKLKNTHEVIMQLNADVIGRKLRSSLNADTMLAQAKAKQNIEKLVIK